MDTLTLFISTVAQVTLIAMQTIQIVAKRPAAAAACAGGIAVSNIVAFKMVPNADSTTMLAYVVTNAIGVPLAMYLGELFARRAAKP